MWIQSDWMISDCFLTDLYFREYRKETTSSFYQISLVYRRYDEHYRLDQKLTQLCQCIIVWFSPD